MTLPAPEAHGASTDTVVYTFRRSVLEKPYTFAIFDDGISIQSEGIPTRLLAWEDITSIRLKYDPTRFDLRRYICVIGTRTMGNLVICSTNFKGIGDFEDQGVSYTIFVQEIHSRLNGRPGVTFKSGDSPVAFGFNAGCAGCGGLMVFLATFFIFLSIAPPIVIGHLIVAFFYVPWLIKYFRTNMPKPYSPSDIPGKILP